MINAETESGAVLICLVIAIDERSIFTRRITTGQPKSFDRDTGNGGRSAINCIAPVPVDIRTTLLALEQRHATAEREDDYRLTTAEKEAFKALDRFVAANLLPTA